MRVKMSPRSVWENFLNIFCLNICSHYILSCQNLNLEVFCEHKPFSTPGIFIIFILVILIGQILAE